MGGGTGGFAGLDRQHGNELLGAEARGASGAGELKIARTQPQQCVMGEGPFDEIYSSLSSCVKKARRSARSWGVMPRLMLSGIRDFS